MNDLDIIMTAQAAKWPTIGGSLEFCQSPGLYVPKVLAMDNCPLFILTSQRKMLTLRAISGALSGYTDLQSARNHRNSLSGPPSLAAGICMKRCGGRSKEPFQKNTGDASPEKHVTLPNSMLCRLK